MKICILMFLFLVKPALAADIPLHQQQIENAAPNQTAIDLSTKKVREHKGVEIQEKFVIPEFHKKAGERETAPQSFCRTCHTPLPHKTQLRTRAFNNMHVRFITCETCHFSHEKLSFRWFDIEKEDVVSGEGLFRVGKNLRQRKTTPKQSENIAPFLDNIRVFLLKNDAFAQQIAATWKTGNETEKATLHAKIHAPLNWQKEDKQNAQKTHQGTPCQECHNDKNSMLDLYALGADKKQMQAITTHIIPRFLEHYQNDDQRITIREMLR
jgi:DNA-directed RNA polymerase subunit M/transcription elongation factor TFIIS